MALSTTPLDARLRLSFRSVRPPQPALALVAALAAGVSLTLAAQPLQAARMSIGVGGKAELPALARLLRSDAVATAVIRDLRLRGVSPSELRARLHVTPRPSVPALDVRYDDRSQAQAQRVAQDIGLVFSQQVLTRFHGETNASISEPAVPAGTLARPWARNLLLAGAAGVALAALVAFLAARRQRTVRASTGV
ncbi:MAG: hypothetical protein ACXVRD_14060 [Gaiellaceae bacterium]